MPPRQAHEITPGGDQILKGQGTLWSEDRPWGGGLGPLLAAGHGGAVAQFPDRHTQKPLPKGTARPREVSLPLMHGAQSETSCCGWAWGPAPRQQQVASPHSGVCRSRPGPSWWEVISAPVQMGIYCAPCLSRRGRSCPPGGLLVGPLLTPASGKAPGAHVRLSVHLPGFLKFSSELLRLNFQVKNMQFWLRPCPRLLCRTWVSWGCPLPCQSEQQFSALEALGHLNT